MICEGEGEGGGGYYSTDHQLCSRIISDGMVMNLRMKSDDPNSVYKCPMSMLFTKAVCDGVTREVQQNIMSKFLNERII